MVQFIYQFMADWLVDVLDPLRQSIQCLLRLGIDRSGMLGRHPPQ